MPFLEMLIPHIPAYLLTLARFGGLFIFAPVFGSPLIPVKIKVLLALSLSAAVYPTLDLHREIPVGLDLMQVAPAMAVETLIGLSIGLIASLPLVSVQMGGMLMGQQMGLGLGAVFNPLLDTEADVTGQILFYMALGVFLSLGGLDAMHASITHSFATVPLGGFAPHDTPLDLLAGLLASGFELAVRVAAPVLCIIFLETVATGLIMKTAPQINILSFGFPIRILLGTAALYASLAAVHEAITVDIEQSMRLAMDWVLTLGGGGAP